MVIKTRKNASFVELLYNLFMNFISNFKVTNLVFIFILSLFLTFDLFLFTGRSITFDGHSHMTMIAQFEQALKSGDFPVRWAGGLANYGSATPIFMHQLTNYLGAGLNFIVQDIVLVYKLLIFVAIFLSNYFWFVFLNKIFSQQASMIGLTLFNIAPYRILSIYLRGSLPELMGSVFFPIFLIIIYNLIESKFKQKKYYIYLIISIFLLVLTHPFSLFLVGVSLSILIFYLILKSENKKDIVELIIVSMIGLGMASYYILPFRYEMKYIIYSHETPVIPDHSYLNLENFFSPKWYYFLTHPGPRGDFIKIGLFETSIILFTVIYIFSVSKKKLEKSKYIFAKYFIFLFILLVFLLTPLSKIVYKLPLFKNIQYPWRFLSIFVYIAPFFITFLFDESKKLKKIILFCLVIVVMSRASQIYGKNYVQYSDNYFYFNKANNIAPHFTSIWSDHGENYSRKKVQAQVIDGDADLKIIQVDNSVREYSINAQEDSRLVDYTFYFPGWRVLIDGKETNIEFQDSKYRGLITYSVPSGNHKVMIKFEETKFRKISNVLSLISIGLFMIYFFVQYQTNRL